MRYFYVYFWLYNIKHTSNPSLLLKKSKNLSWRCVLKKAVASKQAVTWENRHCKLNLKIISIIHKTK